METYHLSLTQFCRHLTKTGVREAKSVLTIHTELNETYDPKTDYWITLRNKIKSVLKHGENSNTFEGLEKSVSPDKADNYLSMVRGLQKWWGNKKFSDSVWDNHTWSHGGIKVNITPEICGEYHKKLYIIKLYLRTNDPLDKGSADMMLQLMHDGIGKDIVENEQVVLGIVDVSCGKMFKYKKTEVEDTLSSLLEF